MKNYLLIGTLAILIIGGSWWYLSQSSLPSTSKTNQLPTSQETNQLPPSQETTNTQTEEVTGSAPDTSQSQNSSGTLFAHPTDGYTFSYDPTKLEARTSSATEFPQNTGLKPSSEVTSGGGYAQEVEILVYQGTIDAAQKAFIDAYKKYYSPEVLDTESVKINGNTARVVTYKVAPTYPEEKLYLIADESQTIVAVGDYDVIASIKTR